MFYFYALCAHSRSQEAQIVFRLNTSTNNATFIVWIHSIILLSKAKIWSLLHNAQSVSYLPLTLIKTLKYKNPNVPFFMSIKNSDKFSFLILNNTLEKYRYHEYKFVDCWWICITNWFWISFITIINITSTIFNIRFSRWITRSRP